MAWDTPSTSNRPRTRAETSRPANPGFDPNREVVGSNILARTIVPVVVGAIAYAVAHLVVDRALHVSGINAIGLSLVLALVAVVLALKWMTRGPGGWQWGDGFGWRRERYAWDDDYRRRGTLGEVVVVEVVADIIDAALD